MYKQPAARCIRFDRNRNTIVMLDQSELPAGHSCEYCAPPKEVAQEVVPSAKVQLTKAEATKAKTSRPTLPYIKFNQNRNIVTMVDDSDVGDDLRLDNDSMSVPKVRLASRKAKDPSAYFGKTMERYLEEARISDEDRAFGQIPFGQMRQMVSSSAAHRRLRSSLAVLGGGLSARVRATRFVTDSPYARRRSFLRPRSNSGRTTKSRPCVWFDRNRNSVVLVDDSELPADHACEHCESSPKRAGQALTATYTAYTGDWTEKSRSRSAEACTCVRFNRNRNTVVLVDSNEQSSDRSCARCNPDLLKKTSEKKTPVRRIRAML